MKIIVIISQTPDTTTKIQVASDGRSIDETGITWILNPYSEFAIEKALKLKESSTLIEEIILLGTGPERLLEALRQGLAMGADSAVLIKSSVLDVGAVGVPGQSDRAMATVVHDRLDVRQL